MQTAEILRSNFRILKPHLNEKSIRLCAALEAKSFGHGGVTLLHEVTGLSRSTITRRIDQVKRDEAFLEITPDKDPLVAGEILW